MLRIGLLIFLLAITKTVFGDVFIYSSKDGVPAAVNLTNKIANNTDAKSITFGTADPSSVAQNASQGSVYINATKIFQKQDNGSSTNWQPLLIGPASGGTDECVVRWDGTGVSFLQNSVFCITDAGVATGLTQFNIDNLRLDGNTVSSTAGDVVIDAFSGNVTLSDVATASRPLKVDASKNIISGTIDLSSSNDVSSILTEPNGGTGADLSGAGTGSIFYQNAGVFSSLAAGTSGQLLQANGAAAPSWIDNKYLSYNSITVVAPIAGTTTTYSTLQAAFNAIPAATNATTARQVYTVVVPSGVYDEDVTININNRKIVVVVVGSASLGTMTGTSWGTGGTTRNLSIFNDGSVATIDGIRSGIAFTSISPNGDGMSTHQAYLSKFRISGDLDISSTIGITTEFYFEGEVFGNLTCASYVGNLNSYVKNSRFRGTFGCANMRLQASINSRFDGLLTTNVYSLIDNSLIGAGMTVTSGTADLNPNGITRTYIAGTFTGPASSLRLDDLTDYWFITNAASLAGGATKSYLEGLRPVANGGTGTNTLTLNNVILGNGTSAVQFVAPGSSGNVLTSNGTTWTSAAPAAAGVQTIGVLDSQAKSADGAVITGTSLVLQTADATNPGMVSTTTQTFAGDKTFTGSITSSSLTAGRCIYAGTAGLISTDAGCTYNDATDALGVTGAITGGSIVDSSLTAGRVTFAGTSGDLSDDADFLFNTTGNVLTLTNSQLNVDNLRLDGNTISSTNTNGNVQVDPDGTGVLDVVGSIVSSSLTSGRVLIAGTAGLITDNASLLYNTVTGIFSTPAIRATSTTQASQPNNPMTTAQRTALTPSTGDCVYDTDLKSQLCYDGANWALQGVQPAIGGWTSATFTSTWVANTTISGFYRQVGDTYEYLVTLSLTGAPTSATLELNLPTGHVIDTTKLPTGFTASGANDHAFGLISILDSGTNIYTGTVHYVDTDTVSAFSMDDAAAAVSSGTGINQVSPITFASGDKVTFHFSAPIVGAAATVGTYSINGKGTVFSAKVSSTGVVSDENTDFINGNCSVASNQATCTWVSSFFTVAPNCVTTPTGTNDAMSPIGSQATATSIRIDTATASTGTGAAYAFNIVCQKQGADFNAASTITASLQDVVKMPNGGTSVKFVSAKIADGTNTTTVSEDTSDFINGNCTNVDASGTTTCTLTTSFFSAAPHCWLQCMGSNRIMQTTTVSTTQVIFTGVTDAGSAADCNTTYLFCKSQ